MVILEEAKCRKMMDEVLIELEQDQCFEHSSYSGLGNTGEYASLSYDFVFA